jgi:hypothetical protein
MLFLSAGRCSMTTKAKPLSAGMFSKSLDAPGGRAQANHWHPWLVSLSHVYAVRRLPVPALEMPFQAISGPERPSKGCPLSAAGVGPRAPPPTRSDTVR